MDQNISIQKADFLEIKKINIRIEDSDMGMKIKGETYYYLSCGRWGTRCIKSKYFIGLFGQSRRFREIILYDFMLRGKKKKEIIGLHFNQELNLCE